MDESINKNIKRNSKPVKQKRKKTINNFTNLESLTKKQKQILEKHTKEITKDASKMVKDYKIKPSNDSGSVIQVNENSPYLEEKYKGKSWKKVIHGSPEDAINFVKSQQVTEPQVSIEPNSDWAQMLQQIQKRDELSKFNKKAQDNFNKKK